MKQAIDINIHAPVPVSLSPRKNEEESDGWEALERLSKVLSIALIPLVLAIGGWLIQRQLQDQSIKRDYVQLAVSILKEPENGKVSPEIRSWAAQLLNDNSPTKLTSEALSQLSRGKAVLPGYLPTSRPIESLQPTVAALARKLIENAALQGIEVRIVKTMVTNEEQDALYASGRSASGPRLTNAKGGQSMHSQGLAFDVAPVVNGEPDFDNIELYKKLGEIGKGLGLTWGGDWQFKDYPHFEYGENAKNGSSK